MFHTTGHIFLLRKIRNFYQISLFRIKIFHILIVDEQKRFVNTSIH